MTQKIRLRFAPSPTGPIHVGNAHTMLFNWLWCRNQGGSFILRFEDTDLERSKPEWETVVINEMQWLGLDWDEGPDIGGPFAPYRQTARMSYYQHYFELLKQKDAVYPCYCTPEELAAERKEADAHKIAYKYSRKCLHLTPKERAAQEARGRNPAWRLLVPENEIVAYKDMLRGQIEFASSTISDPIIVRPNGVPLYNFAVVIDDITMQITDVVRGEGHISNTPVQVLIYRSLGVEPPRFAHVSHLLNEGRGKISKRKGEMSIRSFRERGILREAFFNYLALLGWTPPSAISDTKQPQRAEGEFLQREEIIREFSIYDVNRAAAIFDEEKLKSMNGVYIRSKTREEFAELAVPFVVDAGLVSADALRQNWEWFVELAALVQERVRLLEEIPPYLALFFQDQIEYDEKAVNKYLTPGHVPLLKCVQEQLQTSEWSVAVIEQVVRTSIEMLALGNRQAMLALRVAVTGRDISPPLFESIYLLGREKMQQRLTRWL